MAQVRLHVEVLDFSENALSVIYAACRQCYSSGFAGEIFEKALENLDGREAFIRKVVASGHESPLEHVKFTFAVEGVSRALTHQLVRHRIASYSQQSQRYVSETNFDYIIPPSIERDPDMKREYISVVERVQGGYNALKKCLEEKGRSGESVNEDVRFLLPQAAETKIVVTMNCRELLHLFQERCCSRAQWEIRHLAEEMLKICKEKLPAVFNDAGAKCIKLGYCPEGAQFTCKKYPVKDEVIPPGSSNGDM